MLLRLQGHSLLLALLVVALLNRHHLEVSLKLFPSSDNRKKTSHYSDTGRPPRPILHFGCAMCTSHLIIIRLSHSVMFAGPNRNYPFLLPPMSAYALWPLPYAVSIPSSASFFPVTDLNGTAIDTEILRECSLSEVFFPP